MEHAVELLGEDCNKGISNVIGVHRQKKSSQERASKDNWVEVGRERDPIAQKNVPLTHQSILGTQYHRTMI